MNPFHFTGFQIDRVKDHRRASGPATGKTIVSGGIRHFARNGFPFWIGRESNNHRFVRIDGYISTKPKLTGEFDDFVNHVSVKISGVNRAVANEIYISAFTACDQNIDAAR